LEHRDNSRNNMLIETQTSNYAKHNFETKDYGERRSYRSFVLGETFYFGIQPIGVAFGGANTLQLVQRTRLISAERALAYRGVSSRSIHPIFEGSARCDKWQRTQHCLNKDHVFLETGKQNQARRTHHLGDNGCFCELPCMGPKVEQKVLTWKGLPSLLSLKTRIWWC
jgi:hypothetical protein